MKPTRTKTKTIAVMIGLTLLVITAGAAGAQESLEPNSADQRAEIDGQETSSLGSETPVATSARLRGELPGRPPRVTVRLVDVSVIEALETVCNKARFGLVITGGEVAADKRITLSLKRHPAPEVIELILNAGDLEAELRGTVLFVAPAAAPQERQPTPVPAKHDRAPAEEPAVEPTIESSDAGVAEAASGELEIPINIQTDDGRLEVKAKIKRNRNDRVEVGKSLRIEADEEVRDAVVVGGSLEVAGRVRRDAVAIGGWVSVEPGAVVEGDVAAIGGGIDVQPGAVVHGDKATLGGPMGEMLGGLALSSMRETRSGSGILFGFFYKLLRASILFVLGLLFISFMPERLDRTREYMTRRPGYSVLAGVIIAVAIAPVCFLFAVTVIGIPLIPVVFLFLLALMVVGLSAFLTWLGDRIPVLKDRKTPVVALALGVLLFFVVSLVPVAGTIVIGAVAFFSAGAALLSRFGSEPKPEVQPTPAAS